METELKPCPFCGGTPLHHEHLGIIRCNSCQAEAPDENHIWNTRKEADKLEVLVMHMSSIMRILRNKIVNGSILHEDNLEHYIEISDKLYLEAQILEGLIIKPKERVPLEKHTDKEHSFYLSIKPILDKLTQQNKTMRELITSLVVNMSVPRWLSEKAQQALDEVK